MASYGGLEGILTGLTKSTDHPSTWVVIKIMALFWGPLNARYRILLRTQEGTIILTTTHLYMGLKPYWGTYL